MRTRFMLTLALLLATTAARAEDTVIPVDCLCAADGGR